MHAHLLAAAVALLLVATAEARVQLVTPDGVTPPREQRWADLSQLPTPNVTVELRGRCKAPGAGGSCAARGVIWLAPNARRKTFLHELAHQADWQAPDLKGRLGVERFADAWALCALNGWGGREGQVTRTFYGYRPTLRRHHRLCRRLNRLSKRLGWT